MQYPSDNFMDLVALGKVPGVSRVSALGYNVDVDTGTTPEDIWPGGGLYPFKTSAGVLEILSSSANDAAAGTGCRTVLIRGLDANYAQISEVVSMNGTTAVQTTLQYLRVNSMTGDGVSNTANGTSNLGTITLRDTGAGTTRAIMDIGRGMSTQAIYTVPAGYTLVLYAGEVSINVASAGPARKVDVAFVFRNAAGFVRTTRVMQASDSSPTLLPLTTRLPIAEKTDFIMRCLTADTVNSAVSASWEALLYKN